MPKNSKPAKRQTIKIAIIPLLALILWKVVASDSTDDEPPVASAPVQTATPTSNAAPTNPAPGPPPRNRVWPQRSVEEVVRHNPFTFTGRRDAPPTVAVAEDPAAEAPEPLETEVSAYLLSRNGAVALVDGKLVRVGDVIDDEWIVTELTPEAVMLAPLAKPGVNP